MIVANTLSCYD